MGVKDTKGKPGRAALAHCQTCGGAGEILKDGKRKQCPTCGGTGKNK
jgi:hypothetical protein